MSCTYGKVQVLGIQEVYNEKVFVLRFIQARNPKWVDVPFFAKYDPKATWIDQLKPTLGHTNFFFHDNKHKYDKNDKVMFE
jgi:hypothetical protein